jgi:hypothetical protein
MIDPITAAATATKAYAMVKALVEAGREAHDVMGQIGQWYGAASDVLYAENKAKNPNPFKKIVFSKSVEAEALQLFALKQKMISQQKEILHIINLAYGAQGLEDFRALKKQVAKERKDAVYRQMEMRQQIAQGFLLIVLMGVMAALIAFILS